MGGDIKFTIRNFSLKKSIMSINKVNEIYHLKKVCGASLYDSLKGECTTATF